MIKDLSGAGAQDISADILVIGAGTAGLPVSVMLARAGIRVVCLESGARQQGEEVHPLNEVVHTDMPYEGASLGRSRGLGGTSSRWGGALIPFQAADLDETAWPINFSDLAPYVGDVEALFGLSKGPYDDPLFPFDLGAGYVNRLAKWPPFAKRNVFSLLKDEAESAAGPEIWINATVTRIEVPEEGGVLCEAASMDGCSLRVKAQKVIIAAGAIETTRLALLLDEQNDGAISVVSPKLGRYFSDHLSASVADIVPLEQRLLNRIIGFRFDGAGMRNIRFELSPDAPLRHDLPPSFCHIGFAEDAGGGFEALRQIFRCLQMRRLPSVALVMSLITSAPWLIRAVWWRFVERRLLFPSGARLQAHMVVEQEASEDNYVALSKDRRDGFGVPLAVIHWSPKPRDTETMTRLVDAFEAMWGRTRFAALGRWLRRPVDEVATDVAAGGGIYHPTGSTRMSAVAAEGVVDRDLRLFARTQVQLLATSVLPTGGGANPTMMLMLLAMRCVEQHAQAHLQVHGK